MESGASASQVHVRTVAAIIPCKDETDRIAATVRAVLEREGVDKVVVVDDGSSDDTAAVAALAVLQASIGDWR